eukprot:4804656-Prymnesium_polylepis.1
MLLGIVVSVQMQDVLLPFSDGSCGDRALRGADSKSCRQACFRSIANDSRGRFEFDRNGAAPGGDCRR